MGNSKGRKATTTTTATTTATTTTKTPRRTTKARRTEGHEKARTVLDFIRQNPGCSHDTEGARFHGARLARLHYLLDRGLVRFDREPVEGGPGRSSWRYHYFAVDTRPAPVEASPAPVNPCELCGDDVPGAYYSDPRCNDTGLGVVLHRTCARTIGHMRDEVALAVLGAARDARALDRARDVIASTDAALEHAKSVVRAVEVVESPRPFDAAGELDLARGIAHTIRTRALQCYACDGAVAGVRDRRYMGGRVEFACERHAESNTEAAHAVAIGRAIALASIEPNVIDPDAVERELAAEVDAAVFVDGPGRTRVERTVRVWRGLTGEARDNAAVQAALAAGYRNPEPAVELDVTLAGRGAS